MKKDDLISAMVEHAEIIPIISKEDENFLLNERDIPDVVPILPLRQNVLFPGVILPVSAGRPKSVKLLKQAERRSLCIGVVAQTNDVENPTIDDLYRLGVLARVHKVFELPDGTTMAIVQGTQRFILQEITDDTPYLMGTVAVSPEIESGADDARRIRNLARQVRRQYSAVMASRTHSNGMDSSLKNIGSDKILINFVASHIDGTIPQKQDLLATDSYAKRGELLLQMMSDEMSFARVQNEVQERAKIEMDRQQREYFLNQQMRVIQDELGESPFDNDIADLQARAEKKEWNVEVRSVFDKELGKLKHMHPQSPEYNVQLNYLDLMLDLPWNHISDDNLSVANARKVLNNDHYGIEKVKERVLEYIAILSLKNDMKSPILCLVGPPGTGKTSLGKSIATALGRKYVRVALGGLHDEAEIRGHRRTYIGAMPGRIIQNIKKSGTSNPVFILDEIDKVQANSVHGDATSALLEVLDPEQNSAFHDNYLDVDYDLSKVMFIATANTLSTIQPALLDRMEIIELSGYVHEEKMEIAKRHLIPRQLKEHGMKKSDVVFDDDALSTIINEYTRESGVRQLEKTLAKIVRRRAVSMVEQEELQPAKKLSRKVSQQEIKTALGLPIHNSERSGKEPRIGVVTGLAWTSVGGEILFVESSLSKGKGQLTMTGNLGDVMKESATLAYEYLKSNAAEFGVSDEQLENQNIHIHVPEGATPKDGPSAGITMFIAMLSAFTHRKVNNHVAMTGEITLRGNVTPVGGIKEKILAAKRAGITDIILSEENRRDITDIEQTYLQGLTFHYINKMSEAIPIALLSE
ncbi:MAG: endopeptidase La [Bacteroidales bacterium]|nr:endopeptidase La [Bacteroidales bacterium]